MTSSTSDKPAKKSPLPSTPLPNAGESLRSKREDLIFGGLGFWLAVALLPWLFALLELFRWVTHDRATAGSTLMYAVLAAMTSVVSLVKLRRIATQIKHIGRGLAGEEWVGQYLEQQCRPMGYSVFHDILGDDFNLDHVLIGPGGIFVIETKTISQRTDIRNCVRYDGQSVLINGLIPDRDPVVQAKALGKYLAAILANSTGVDPATIPVQPVVLYPGWYIEGTSSGKDVWVLHHKPLIQFMRFEKRRLSPEQVAMFSHHIEMHIRAKRNK